MGIRLKEVKIKPGTKLWQAVTADYYMLNTHEQALIDNNNRVWTTCTYIGYNPKHQLVWVHLDDFFGPSNIKNVIPKLTGIVDHHCYDPDNPFKSDEMYLIEPEDGVIGYDFQNGKLMNEYVGEITLIPPPIKCIE